MKKKIIYVIIAVLFFSLGFLTNHLLNRVLNTACSDMESYNKMQSGVQGDEELKVMHEGFKKQKLEGGLENTLPQK